MSSNNKYKKTLLLIIFAFVISVIGFSFAWFNYSKTSVGGKVITGSLYLMMNEGTDTINLTNMFPETKEEARARNDNTLTFTVSGKNTNTSKPIVYEILLDEGTDQNNKQRFDSKDLVFDLVEIDSNNQETYVLDAVSYEEFNDTRIWVDSVAANTTEEIEKTYRLRMWLSEDVLISDSDPNADYKATGEDAFSQHYANIKVAVQGDLAEKELPLRVETSESGVDSNGRNYVSNVIENNENTENTYKLNITSSNSNIQFIYNENDDVVSNISSENINAIAKMLVYDETKAKVKKLAGGEESYDSFEKEYQLAGSKKISFNISLVTKTNKTETADLTFTLRKNGEIVQEVVKHVKVSGLKYQIIFTDKVTTYTGNPITIDNIVIKNPDDSAYNGTHSITYYNGNSCSGNKIDLAPVNVGEYSEKIVVPESNAAEETSACGKITIVAADMLITITQTGGTYNGSAIPVETTPSQNVEVRYYTDNQCTTLIDSSNPTKVPVDAGVYYAKASATGGNYNNSTTACTSHEITAKSISASNVTLSDSSVIYTGENQEVEVTITDGSKTLVEGTDYDVTYSNNQNAGEATVTITMKGNYSGTIEKHFNITKATITIPSSPSDKRYTGTVQNHGVTIPSHTSIVTNGSTLSATSKGTYKVILSLDDSSNFKWSDNTTTNKEITWKIVEKTVLEEDITLSNSTYTYDGSDKEPSVVVKDGNITLTEGTDYEISYSNNKNAGEATVTITLKGNYEGTIIKHFTINKATITVPSSPADKTYNRSSQNHGITIPSHTSVVSTGSTTSATNVGNYNVIIKLDDTNNYEWNDHSITNKTIAWKIVAKAANTLTTTLAYDDVDYDGSAKEPSVTVKDGTASLVAGTDYDVTYSSNTNAGEATVTITMKGNYTGTVTEHFTINKATITVPSSPADKVYTGTSQNHGVTIPNHTSIVTTGSTLSATSVDDYKVIIKLDNSSNYKWNDNSVSNKEITWKIVKSNTTTTLSDINRDYTGEYQEASGATSKLSSNNTDITGATYTYAYYSDSGCNTITTTPKESATYYVKATLNSTVNYNSSVSACKKFTISNRESTMTLNKDNLSLTYSESGNVTYTFDGDGAITCSSAPNDYVTCSVDTTNHKINVTAIKATTTPVTVTVHAAAGTFYSSTEATFTVSVAKKTLTITAKNQTINYGGSITTGTNQITSTGLVSGHTIDSVTLTPSTANVPGGTITPSVAVIKDGNVTVTSNYDISYNTGTLTINKIDATCPTTTATTATYDKESHSITVGNDAVGGTVEYRTSTSGDGSTWTTTKPTRTNVGETTVYVRVNGDNNHNTKNCDSKKVTINAKTLTATVSASNKQYDGNATATCSSSVSLSGVITGDTVTASANTTGAFDNKNIGNNKTVTCSGITLSGTSASNYTVASSQTTTANISKKQVTATISSCENKTYDGDTSATCTLNSLTGLVSGETASAKLGTCTFDNKNVGTGKTVTCTGISLDGTNKGNYELTSTSATKTANITPKTLTATVTASDKEYDGTTSATCSSSVTLTGIITGDTVTASASTTGSFENKTVGTDKTVTCSGITLSGTSAGNYTVASTKTTTADITKKHVTATIASCDSREYNGNTDATCALSSLSGVVSGETASAKLGTCAFNNKNVGTDKTVTCTGISLDGTNKGNYELTSTSATKTANITAKTLTAAVTANDKEYDGTTSATCSSSVSLTGVITGDTVTAAANTTGSFASASVGEDKTVTCTGIALSGTDKNNYTVASTKTTTANITKKQVTPTISSCTSKTYDGNTNASCTLSSLSGVISGETASAKLGTCTFDNKNAGTGKTVTCSGITLDGTNKGNYELTSTSATKTANINKAALTVKADNKAIDYGNNAPTYTYTATGFVNNETTSVLTGTATYTIKDGDTTITVGSTTPVGTYTIIPSGLSATNYEITYQNGSLSIGSKDATCPSNFNNYSGQYDGSNHGITANGAIGGTIQYTTLASGDDSRWSTTAPTRKDVGETTVYVRVKGDSNHNTVECGSKKITISQKAITITAKDQTVQYGTSISQGTNQVTVATLVSGETLDSITLTQSKTAVSSDGKITPSSAVIKNGDNNVTGNYSITYSTGDLTINKKDVTASVSSCSNKEYNGNTTANCTLTVNGKVGSETVNASGTCTFNNKNVGTGKTVTCGSLTLSGTNAGNYNLTSTSITGTANITVKSLTATVSASDKEYDGTTTATCSSTVTLSGVVTGDTVTASASTTGSFDNKNIGTDKTVTCTGITLSGTDKNNYTVASSKTTTADINKKKLSPTLSSCSNKTYDGTTSATCTLNSLSGVITGETATVTLGTCAFDNKNVGTGKTVTCSVTLDGTDKGNYELNSANITKTANITAKALTITADDKSMTYGGSAPTYTYTPSGFVNGETNSVLSGTATYTIKSGNTTITNVAGAAPGTYTIIPGGLSATNYSISYVNGTLTIGNKSLTASVSTCTNREYNGTNSVSCTITLSGVESGDTVTAAGTCTVPSGNVGTGKTVTCSNITLSGANSNKYVLSSNSVTKNSAVNITAKSLTPSITSCTNREYNGTNTVTCSIAVATKIGSEDVGATGTCTVASGNIGTGKKVTCSSITLTGEDKGNYALTSTTIEKDSAVNITAKSLTPSISSCTNRAYNGSKNVTCSLIVATKVGSEDVGASGTCAVASANAGTNKTVTCSSITLTGEDKGNYTLSSTSVEKASAVNITQVPLTITAADKTMTYGGSAPSYSYTASGFVNSETTSVLSGTISYKVKNGSGTEITVGSSTAAGEYTITPSGLSATNYSISFVDGTLTINKATNPISVTTPQAISTSYATTAQDKTFTAASNAQGNVTYSIVSQKQGDTTVNYFSIPTSSTNSIRLAASTPAGSYTVVVKASAAGNGNYESGNKEITLNITVSSVDATCPTTFTAYTGTYDRSSHTITATGHTGGTLQYRTATSGDGSTWTTTKPTRTNVGETTVYVRVLGEGSYNTVDCGNKKITINAKELTATVSASDKEYDGTTSATCSSSVTLTGVITGDTVTATANTTGSFASASVGADKAVTCSGITLSGTNAGNYTVASSKTTTADINKKQVTATISSCSNKTYDGTTSATCTLSSLSGIVSGETASAKLGTCTFNNKNVGNGKTVTCSGITLDGTNKGNYELTSTSATKTANITAKSLTITADNKSMTYGGSAPSYSYTVNSSDLATGDTVSVVTGTATYTIKSGNTTITNVTTATAGTYTIILSGLSASNYSITYADGSLTINRQKIVFPTCESKVYTGSSQTLFAAHSSGEYTNSAITGTNAGSYTGDLTPGSNYEWSSGSNVTSKRTLTCQITKSDTTTTLEDITKPYTGNSQEAEGAVSKLSSNNTTITNAAYTYAYYSNSTCTTSTTTPKAAGTYYVIATLTGTSNYNSSSSECAKFSIGSGTATLTVTPATLALTYKTAGNVSYTYNGDGALSCTSSDTSKVTCSVDTTNHKINVTPVAVTSSAVTITVNAAQGANYAPISKTFTVTVAAKAITITAKDQTVQYGTAITQGTNQVTVATLASGDSLDSITLTQSKTAVSSDGKITPSVAVIKNGNNNVTSNYSITYNTGDLTVSKKDITASVTSCSNKTYDGTTSANCTLAVNGKIGNETVTVSGTCTFNNKNVGNAKTVTCGNLTLSGTNAGNYNLTSTSITGSANITAKSLTITADNKSMTYGGSAPSYSYTVNSSDLASGDTTSVVTGTATYTIKSGNTTITNVTGAAAGTYTIIPGGLSATNYSITYVNGTLTINRQNITFPTCSDVVYTGSEQTLFAAHSSGTYTNDVLKGTNVNNYTIDLTPTSNYQWSSGSNVTSARTLTCKIVQSDTTTTLSNQSFNYTGTAQTPTGATSTLNSNDSTISGASYTYTYYGTSANCSAGTSALSGTPTNVGTYYVKATLTATTNYKTSTSGCVTYTINTVTLEGGSVAISGTNTWGNTLTATITDTSPVASYSCAWYYNSNNSVSGGTKIADATISNKKCTYEIDSDYIGKYIYVVITATKTGYNTKTLTDITDATTNGTATVSRKGVAFPSCTSKVYTGSSQTLFAAHSSGEYTNSAITGTNVGSYTGDLTPTANYQWSSGSSVTSARTLTCQITQSSTTTTLGNISKTYTGSAQAASGATSKLANNTAISNGSYTYAYYGTSANCSAGTNALSGAPTNVGTYYVKATLTATDNYASSTSSCATYTMSQKKATITPESSSKALTYPTAGTVTYTYDGTATVSCASADETYVTCSVNTSTKTVTLTPVKPTSSAVNVTLSAGANGNYSAPDNKTISVTVAKGTLTATATALNGTYSGSEQYAKIKVTKSDWDGKTIVSGTSTSYGTTVTSNGAYNTDYNLKPGYTNVTSSTTIYYKITGGTYYNDLTGSTTATIGKKKATITLGTTPSMTFGTDSNLTYTYDGDGTVSCTSSDTSAVTCSVDSTNNKIVLHPVKATTSNVTITVSAGAGTNYSAADNKTATVTVARKAIAFPTCESKVYTGGIQTLFAARTSGAYTNSAITGTNVDSYTGSLTPGSNYQWSSGSNVTSARTLTCSITKSDTTTTLSNINKSYTGSAQAASGATAKLNSNNSTIGGAAFTYTYYGSSANCSAGTNALSGAPTNVGTYYVTATLTGTGNYNGSTSSCATYTMSQKKATITPASSTKELTYPTAGTVTYTFDGTATVSCASADETYVTCSVNTSTKTVTLTPVKVTSSAVTVTLSAGSNGNYSAPDNKTISVTVVNGTLQGSVKITGTNTWGNTLTATVTNTNNASLTYKWYYSTTAGATSGGTAVGDQNCNTGSTCVIPSSLVGKYIYVVVSASKTNYTSTSWTDATDATENTTQAVAKQPAPAISVAITGTNTWGNTLTATITSTSAGTKGYKWYYNSSNSTSGGTAVEDTNCNTGSTCVIPSSLVGKYIYVKGSVAASDIYLAATDAYDITDTSANTTATVDKKTPTVTTTVTGTTKWGDTLTCSATNTGNGSSYTYAWYYTTTSGGTSGTAIANQTGSTYVISQDYIGKYIGCTATVAATSTFKQASKGIATTSTVAKKTGTNSVAISGTNTWGSTLTATITTNSDGTKGYTWYYSSTAGATSGGTAVNVTNCNTGSTCVIPSSLVGKYIYVVGTVGSSSYYTTPSNSVDATDASTNTTQAVAKKASSMTLASTKALTYPTAGTESYTYDGDGNVTCSSADETYVTCSVNTSTKVLTLTPVKVTSSAIAVTLNAAEGSTYKSTSKTINVTVGNGTLSGSVKITGTNTWGSTLTATVTNTNSANLTYKWYYSTTAGATSGGTAVGDTNCNTGSTCVIPNSLVGKYIYVVVSASKTNYTSTSWTDATDATENTTQAVAKKTGTNSIKITGTNTWGSTLTATITTNSDGAKGYTWYYSSTAGATSGGTAVNVTNCNTGSTCVIPSSLVGKYIYVVGTVGNSSYYTTPSNSVDATDASTNTTQAVDKKTPTVTTSVSGTTTWGETLTCSATNTGDGTSYTYAWYYTTTSGGTSGTAIANQTGSTYVVAQDYIGKYIGCTATVAATTTYKQASAGKATTATIAKKTGTNSIKITGTNTWGNTLTATITTNSDGAKGYTWYYSSTAGATSGGTAVNVTNCNTGSTCVIPSSLVGKYIYVVGTVGNSSYYTTPSNSTDATDASTNTTQAVDKKTPTVTTSVSGTTTWGETLTCSATNTGDGTSYTYAWYYTTTSGGTSGTAIANQTGSTYVVAQDYIGKYIGCTATVAATTTYKQASAGKATTATIAKKTCPAPTNVTIGTDAKVSWTNASGASSYQISMSSSSGFAAHTNGSVYSAITSATGTRTVYVRSVCNTDLYTSANSANASKSTTVYSVTLTKGTGISAVSGAGNYITGATVTLGATIESGYKWVNWTQTSGGTEISTTQAYSSTITSNWAYTANGTEDIYTATFYYNGTNGVTSTTAQCTISNGSCAATIPTAVKNSTGTYSNAYYGLSESTGNMTAVANASATSVTLTGNKTYYALYSSAVTINYPATTTTKSSATAYRNQWLTSTSAMATTVLATSATGTSNNYSFSSSISGYDLYGFATSAGTNTKTYNDVAAVKTSTEKTVYAILSKSENATFYYSNSAAGAKTSTTVSGTQYVRCTSSAAEINNPSVSAPSSLTGETAPTGTASVGWSNSASSMSTTTTYQVAGSYYKAYRNTVSIVRPSAASGTDSCATISVYRNAYYGSSTNYTVNIASSNTGTSDITSISGLTGTFKGYSTSSNTGTVTSGLTTVAASIKARSETKYYAISTYNNTSATATFYYSNSSTGTKTSTTATGTQVRNAYCSNDTTATSNVNSQGTVTAPTLSGETAPYGTTSVGWASGVGSMSTTTSYQTGGTYYKVYRTNDVKLYYPSSANEASSTNTYRNAFVNAASDTSYTVVLASTNTGTSNVSNSTVPSGYTFYGYANAVSRNNKDYANVAAVATSTATAAYALGTKSESENATFYYSNSNAGAKTSTTVGGTKTTYVRCTSTTGAGTNVTHSTVSAPTLTGEVAPYGTASVSWSSSVNSVSTTTSYTSGSSYYKVYRSALTIYYPTSTSAVTSKNNVLYRIGVVNSASDTSYTRRIVNGTSSVTQVTNSDITSSLLANMYGTFTGVATSANSTSASDINTSGVVSPSANTTTYYAVNTYTESENATFYYSNSAAGAKTSTTSSGTRTNYVYCSNTTTAKTSLKSHSTVSAPTLSDEVAPYGTTSVGWSNSLNSVSTTTTYTSGSSYYKVYRSALTIYYPTSTSAVTSKNNVLYRIGIVWQESDVNYTINIVNGTSSVTPLRDADITSSVLANMYGTFTGVATSANSTSASSIVSTGVVRPSANTTTYYAVNTYTESENATFYYSNSNTGTKTSTTASGTRTNYVYCSSTSAATTSLKSHSTVSAPTLSGEVAPYGTESVGWSSSVNSVSTTTSYQTGGTYYKVYRSALTIYYPTSTSAVTSKNNVLYRIGVINGSSDTSYTRRIVNGTSSVKQVINSDITSSVLANMYGTFTGVATSANSTSASDINASSVVSPSANTTTYYAVNIYTESENATFYYSNSNTGTKTSTTASGAKTNYVYCSSTSAATTSLKSHGTIVNAPTLSGEVAPYGTTSVGWASSASSMSTTTTYTSGNSYYKVYRNPSITYKYAPNSENITTSTINRNAYYGTGSKYSVVLASGSVSTTNMSNPTISGYTFYGYSSTPGTSTKEFNNVSEAATSTATTIYAIGVKEVSVTFYYSNSSTGAKANSSTSGSRYLIFNSSGSGLTVEDSSITSPTGTAPYGTSLVGWATANNTMTTGTVNTANTSYYAVYRGNVTNYYYDGSAYTTRTLYRNGLYGSDTNYSMYLATADTGTSNYSTAAGPGSSAWAGLSTAADTTAEYATVAAATASNSASLYTVYQYNVTYTAGSNVSAVGSATGNCKVSATGASAGGTSCTVTLPSITPNTGYHSVGWNTTSGATTGTASGQSYTISSNPTTLYANAVDVWAENVSYDDTNTGLGCTDTQCALDELSLMLNPSLLNNETCPGPRCVYSKASNNVIGSTISGSHGITGDNNTDYFDNYNSFTENVFLAHVLAGNIIVSSFVCGIENNSVYCLRGGVEEDSPHPIFTYNVNQVNTAIPTCNAVDTGHNAYCTGTNTSTYFYITGIVSTSNDLGSWGCSIWDDGSSDCS